MFNGAALQQLERLIRETVDVHAEAEVDIVSLCFFARCSDQT